MKTLFILAATMSFAAGCGDPYGAPDDTPYDDELELGQSTDALKIGSGGSTLGYQCTTTISGTSCTCTEGVGPEDPQTCEGMGAHCHNKGATINCTYPPGGVYACSCSFAKLSSSVKPIAPGGDLVFSP